MLKAMIFRQNANKDNDLALNTDGPRKHCGNLLMLAALIAVFALSFAFRTTVTLAAKQLEEAFGISTQTLASVAAVFHICFALAQPVVGIALDRYGPRRTVIIAFALAVFGCILSASAGHLEVLILGQALIGTGCSPALLAAMVFITRRYPADQFATLSGLVMALGGIGMLITGTPLAWVVETWSWRVGFWVLTALAALSWVAVFVCRDGERSDAATSNETIGSTLEGFGTILKQPHTAGILCLGATSYAAFLALRGLWLGPLLMERHGFSLVEVGHVAFAISLVGLLGPLVFGRLDRDGRGRRAIIISCSLGYVALFLGLVGRNSAAVDVALVLIVGAFVGYIVLQYADVRSAYPTEAIGRALAVFTMAMFLGVAAMQWISGVAATLATDQGIDPIRAALLTISSVLCAGTVAFWLLAWPPQNPSSGGTTQK
jgi:predicted MFS family arabinose efflux permease